MLSDSYEGATSLFMTVLLNKKYSLPYVLIDALVSYFARFEQDERELPVLWHQCLLTFVQRYKMELTAEQKESLRPLLKKHFHHQITPEIRRELFTTANRGEAMESFSLVCWRSVVGVPFRERPFISTDCSFTSFNRSSIHYYQQNIHPLLSTNTALRILSNHRIEQRLRRDRGKLAVTRKNRQLARQHEELLPHRLLQLLQTARETPLPLSLRAAARTHTVAQQRVAREEEVAEAVADGSRRVARRRDDGALRVSPGAVRPCDPRHRSSPGPSRNGGRSRSETTPTRTSSPSTCPDVSALSRSGFSASAT